MAEAFSYEFVVVEEQAGSRLDVYLAAMAARLGLARSRSQLKRLIEEGRCQVSGVRARPAQRLKAGESVSLTLPPPEPDQALPEEIPLVVLHEDEHLIVIDKPAGMVVHPAAGHRRGTLVNALLGHCTSLSGVGGTLRPGIVHRLDKLTSGVLVASKSDAAHLGLAEQFARHSVERRYLAVVAGQLAMPSGTFDTLYGRHPTHRQRFTSRCRQGRRAVTHFRVLRPLRGATLVEARLETGRTHQVRVHFADAGHPVLGDPMYGRPCAEREAREAARRIGRQALHARLLAFDHPLTGQRLRFVTPPPADVQELLAALALEGPEERR
jgi:23S rRNA pseudouridine1911/1915/1917 synthase